MTLRESLEELRARLTALSEMSEELLIVGHDLENSFEEADGAAVATMQDLELNMDRAGEKHLRIQELEGAIRKVINTNYDEICWLDVLKDLAALVGETFDPKLLSREQFEKNCKAYADHVYTGVPYAPDVTREELWMEYAALLTEEAAMFVGFASNHGAYASEEAIAEGIRLRAALNITPEQLREYLSQKRAARKS